MAYLVYSTVFALLILSSFLVLTRNHWLPILFASTSNISLPGSSTASHLYSQIPSVHIPTFGFGGDHDGDSEGGSSFFRDVEAGLHSSNFNLAENIEGGDERAGLDERGRKEVLRIMRQNKGKWRGKDMSFDEAREVYMQERFKKMGIAADGRPRDPKFVSFS